MLLFKIGARSALCQTASQQTGQTQNATRPLSYHSDEGQFLLPQLADLLPGESPSPHLLDPADGEDGGEALLGDLSLLCGRRLLPPDVLHEFGPQAALAGALVPLQDQESLVDAHMLTWRLGKKERINAFTYSSITYTLYSSLTIHIFNFSRY